MDQTRVVLDCDTANEVDDQFAIAYALGLPVGTLDVRGVISVHNTTAHGPGSRDMYQEEAERVVALCARWDGPSHRTWPGSCSLWPPNTRTGPERNCGTWPASPPIQEP